MGESMNTQYAKPHFTHSDFRVGNLYRFINETEFTIEIVLKEKNVIAKKCNFEIVNCIFNDTEKAE